MPILLSQLTRPTSTRWATIAQAKSRLLAAEVAAGGSALDDLLSDLLDEASATASAAINRSQGRAQYLQSLPGYGTQQLRLGVGPLESTDLVLTLRGVAIDPALYLVDSLHALLIRTDAQLWELTARYVGAAPGQAIPMGSDLSPDYSATFWAGYRMPEDDPDAPGVPFPAELRGVVLRMVTSAYRAIQRGGEGIKMLKKADRQIQWYGTHLTDQDTAILQYEKDKVGP